MSGLFRVWLKFNAVGIAGMGVQLLALIALTAGLELHYLVATLLAVETGKQSDLTRKPMESFSPTWSPDGKQLAFLTCICASWAGDDPHRTGELWVTNADGTNLHRLAKGNWGSPSWLRAVPMNPAFTGR